MSVTDVIGMLTAFTLLLPVSIIWIGNLSDNKYLLAVLFYFLTTSLYYFTQQPLIPVSNDLQTTCTVIFHYIEIPLMLAALMLFATSAKKKRFLAVITGMFISYELIIGILLNFNLRSIPYIAGPGIFLILIYAIYYFRQYAKLSVERNKFFDRALMISSVLFSYTCNGMVFCFVYIQKTSAVEDVFLIRYIALFISAIAMSIGLILLYKKRKKIKEVQLTRKELAIFFEH